MGGEFARTRLNLNSKENFKSCIYSNFCKIFKLFRTLSFGRGCVLGSNMPYSILLNFSGRVDLKLKSKVSFLVYSFAHSWGRYLCSEP